LSNENIQQLVEKRCEYILGATIKNETEAITEQILHLALTDDDSYLIEKENKERLTISYSVSRAKKDAHNRKCGIKAASICAAVGLHPMLASLPSAVATVGSSVSTL
jgi:hypothetical protein